MSGKLVGLRLLPLPVYRIVHLRTYLNDKLSSQRLAFNKKVWASCSGTGKDTHVFSVCRSNKRNSNSCQYIQIKLGEHGINGFGPEENEED